MGHTVKIDERAFNKGVNEVLKLKPIKRAIYSMIYHAPPSEGRSERGKGVAVYNSKNKPERTPERD